MQKKFLFTALLEDDESTLPGKVFLFGLQEYVFDGLPETGIYFNLKKENGEWVQTHGPATFGIYIEQVSEQIDVFLDGSVTY
jgi:hypothetical protein